jgi:hypothetical protein
MVAEMAPIMTMGSNLTIPIVMAKINIPPTAMTAFEIKMIFRQLSTVSASSSI